MKDAYIKSPGSTDYVLQNPSWINVQETIVTSITDMEIPYTNLQVLGFGQKNI